MNMEAVPCPAARAAKAIAREDVFPVAAEVILRMPAGAVTSRAQPGDRGDPFAAGTEQRLRAATPLRGSPQEAFLAVAEG